MTGKNLEDSGAKLTAVNDNRPSPGRPGDGQDDALWSTSDLIPLVRLLARQAATELFHEAANDNCRSQQKRPKE
jgi:hypothetical protein